MIEYSKPIYAVMSDASGKKICIGNIVYRDLENGSAYAFEASNAHSISFETLRLIANKLEALNNGT